MQIRKNKNIVIMGLGKISVELSKNIIQQGASVSGFTSNIQRAKILNKIGVKVFKINQLDKFIKNADSLLITAPPDEKGCPVIRKSQKAITDSNINWIGYISSTAVYGDYSGERVDENSILKSKTMRGIFRIKAEEYIKNFSKISKKSLCIFRLSGIYGLERNILKEILSNQFIPVYKKGHFFNRIHELDIARIVSKAAIMGNFEGTVNLSDDKPSSQLAVAHFAYKLLKKKMPKVLIYDEIQNNLSPISKSFWENNRRIDNRFLKENFGEMIYPNYKKGLSDIYNFYINNSSYKF